MSAFVPEVEHVDVLVKIADVLIGCDRDATGQMLVDEVVKSVGYRYSDCDVQAGELPGPCDPYYLRPYSYVDRGFMPNAPEMRDLISCYGYQACEHPGWEASEARSLCDEMLARLGDGPSSGDWGYEPIAARYGKVMS